MAREDLLVRTFVELADNLVADFDAVELMSRLADRSVELLGATAAGLLLADPQGALMVVAASTEAAHLLELFQLQNEEGPCLDCFRSGAPVVSDDLAAERRWPLFGPEATKAGFRSVSALPMRLRNKVIGALNIFRADPGPLPAEDLQLGQALADVATITILQEQLLRDAELLSDQLQRALNSRVVIEQAKGTIAERIHVDVDNAFTRMRHYARSHNRRLSDVAQEVIVGSLPIDELTDPAQPSAV